MRLLVHKFSLYTSQKKPRRRSGVISPSPTRGTQDRGLHAQKTPDDTKQKLPFQYNAAACQQFPGKTWVRPRSLEVASSDRRSLVCFNTPWVTLASGWWNNEPISWVMIGDVRNSAARLQVNLAGQAIVLRIRSILEMHEKVPASDTWNAAMFFNAPPSAQALSRTHARI
jgi:hypothetical protein